MDMLSMINYQLLLQSVILLWATLAKIHNIPDLGDFLLSVIPFIVCDSIFNVYNFVTLLFSLYYLDISISSFIVLQPNVG
jgi:hypothetical protein